MGEPGRIAAVSKPVPMPQGAVYTPCSVGSLERIVKLFARYYPRRTTAECRDVLAWMYGHDSWMLLETAAICGEPSGCDEDEAAETVRARREHQYCIALAGLGGVTEETSASAARVEKELAASGPLSISRRHDPYWRRRRIERARHSYEVAYARHAIDEIRPTARDRLALAGDADNLHTSVRVELLPRALSVWLDHQRPRFNGLAERVAASRIAQRSQCDLLNFAFLWGEACVTHPADIPDAVQIYPLALCAQWYAWNAGEDAIDARAATLSRQPPPLHPAHGLAATTEHQRTLLRAQPRDDVLSLRPAARERQMAAGYATLRQHMTEAASASPYRQLMTRPLRAAVH